MIYGTITIRTPVTILEKIEHDVKTGSFRSRTDAITQYLQAGIRISEYQEMLKDPAKAAEFQQKMQAVIQDEKLEGWIESLSSQQLDGLMGLMEIEKDKRHDQRRLI
ncbi:MAG: hypothetical protein OXC46_11375 [Thaumarchaeota archaeon]|nr:hypothetical protein [Nitrososphaerota archaeon]